MSEEIDIEHEDDGKIIRVTYPKCIVGCSGAGGTHSEIDGYHEITIDLNDMTIQVDRISRVDSCECSGFINLDDLIGEMEHTVAVIKNKEEIKQVRNLFKKL